MDMAHQNRLAGHLYLNSCSITQSLGRINHFEAHFRVCGGRKQVSWFGKFGEHGEVQPCDLCPPFACHSGSGCIATSEGLVHHCKRLIEKAVRKHRSTSLQSCFLKQLDTATPGVSTTPSKMLRSPDSGNFQLSGVCEPRVESLINIFTRASLWVWIGIQRPDPRSLDQSSVCLFAVE